MTVGTSAAGLAMPIEAIGCITIRSGRQKDIILLAACSFPSITWAEAPPTPVGMLLRP